MKKLFLALALTGIVGASSIGTVAAITHAKVVVCGGEECKHKKHKKCKKGDACTHSKTTAGADKKCTKEGAKKCCSSAASQTKTCAGKTANTPQAAPAVKPLEVE